MESSSDSVLFWCRMGEWWCCVVDEVVVVLFFFGSSCPFDGRRLTELQPRPHESTKIPQLLSTSTLINLNKLSTSMPWKPWSLIGLSRLVETRRKSYTNWSESELRWNPSLWSTPIDSERWWSPSESGVRRFEFRGSTLCKNFEYLCAVLRVDSWCLSSRSPQSCLSRWIWFLKRVVDCFLSPCLGICSYEYSKAGVGQVIELMAEAIFESLAIVESLTYPRYLPEGRFPWRSSLN